MAENNRQGGKRGVTLKYSWKARNRHGAMQSGEVQAISEQAAAAYVRDRYGYVTELKQVTRVNFFRRRRSFSAKQRVLFFRQLATLLHSGIPLLRAVELLQLRSGSGVSELCERLAEKLYAGESLSAAMGSEAKFFPELAVKLGMAGEKSGGLEQVLAETAAYYARQEELRAFLTKAAAYPLFLLTAALGVLLFFLLYVLPLLAATYTSLQAAPGGMLRLALTLNQWLQAAPLLGIAVPLVTLAVIYARRQFFCRAVLRLPLVRELYRLLLEARFCKLLALLLSSGLGITAAVSTAGAAAGDSAWQRRLYLFNNKLGRGMDIGLAAQDDRQLFSPVTAEFIAVGAATGSLPRLLEEAALMAEGDLRTRLEKMKEIFAPVLLLVAALLTGAVICSVLGPLFDLFTALPEYN